MACPTSDQLILRAIRIFTKRTELTIPVYNFVNKVVRIALKMASDGLCGRLMKNWAEYFRYKSKAYYVIPAFWRGRSGCVGPSVDLWTVPVCMR